MQLVIGGFALVACVAAVWFAVLHLRTTRSSGSQIMGLNEQLERFRAALEGVKDVERRSATLEAAAEVLPLGVIVTGPEGRVLFRNHAAETLLGTRPADALSSGAVAELIAAAVAGDTQTRPLELYGPPRRTLALTGVPLPGPGAAVIVEDVSERGRLEAVRRDFVANVSHELKTPVAALGLLAETLASEEDLAVVRRLAGRMQDEAFRVNHIIDDLLDLSRLEGEPASLHEPVPVEGLVTEAVDHVRPSAGFRGIDILVEKIPRSWNLVGDRRQLVSALANLLENAVKYSDDGSEVSVRAGTDGTTISLQVQDRGVGIPSRELDRIFERFYRVDRGRGRGTGGTGLGLAIVRHVATNHGGDVQVSSLEGEGSLFTLLLPAGPGPVAPVAKAG